MITKVFNDFFTCIAFSKMIVLLRIASKIRLRLKIKINSDNPIILGLLVLNPVWECSQISVLLGFIVIFTLNVEIVEKTLLNRCIFN